MLKIFNRVKIFRSGQKKKPQQERCCGFFGLVDVCPSVKKGGEKHRRANAFLQKRIAFSRVMKKGRKNSPQLTLLL